MSVVNDLFSQMESILRWQVTVTSTFQHLYLNGSVPPLLKRLQETNAQLLVNHRRRQRYNLIKIKNTPILPVNPYNSETSIVTSMFCCGCFAKLTMEVVTIC